MFFICFYISIDIVHILKLEIYIGIRGVIKYQRNQLCASVLLHQLIFRVCVCHLPPQHTAMVPATRSYVTINTKLRYHLYAATVPLTQRYGIINTKLRYHQHKAMVPLTQSYSTINKQLRYHHHQTTVPLTQSYGTFNTKLRYHQHITTVPSTRIYGTIILTSIKLASSQKLILAVLYMEIKCFLCNFYICFYKKRYA